MKYNDWCVDYYKKENPGFQEKIDSRKKQEITREITERLLLRLNCLTGKFYGVGREFGTVCYTAVVDVEEIINKVTEHYQRIEAERKKLRSTYRARKNDIKKLIENKKGKITNSKLRREIDKKQDKMKEIKRRYYALQDRKIEGINIERKRFAEISEIESAFFEFLLTIITEEKIRKISNDEWECLDSENREIIIQLIHEVKELLEWQLSEDEVKYIEFKLRYPVLHRLILVQDVLETDEKLARDDDIKKKMESIRENVDSLYEIACKRKEAVEIPMEKEIDIDDLKKECPVLYDAIKEFVKEQKD